MKKILLGIILILMFLSSYSSFYEYKLAQRSYSSMLKLHKEGYYKKYLTFEELNISNINSERYFYNTFKQKMYLDLFLFLFVLIFINKYYRNKPC